MIRSDQFKLPMTDTAFLWQAQFLFLFLLHPYWYLHSQVHTRTKLQLLEPNYIRHEINADIFQEACG